MNLRVLVTEWQNHTGENHIAWKIEFGLILWFHTSNSSLSCPEYIFPYFHNLTLLLWDEYFTLSPFPLKRPAVIDLFPLSSWSNLETEWHHKTALHFGCSWRISQSLNCRAGKTFNYFMAFASFLFPALPYLFHCLCLKYQKDIFVYIRMWLIACIYYALLAASAIKLSLFHFLLFICLSLNPGLRDKPLSAGREGRLRKCHIRKDSKTTRAEFEGAGDLQRWVKRAKELLLWQKAYSSSLVA